MNLRSTSNAIAYLQAEPVLLGERRALSYFDRLLQYGVPSRELVFDGRRTAHDVPVRGQRRNPAGPHGRPLFTGAIPHTEKLGLHWIAEVGNGLSSNSNVTESVQNFYSDRNYKATNLPLYFRPGIPSGLQTADLGITTAQPHAGIESFTGSRNQAKHRERLRRIHRGTLGIYDRRGATEQSPHGNRRNVSQPHGYAQVARSFGIYKPYFRYQFVNDKYGDPINLLRGTYYGPSLGIRVDFAQYAAFKLQYNHLFESKQPAGNGLNAQVAFTF